jgi:hypothetical protein
MSESSEAEGFDSAPAEDMVRQHSQDPAEGPDEKDDQKDEPPRVHSEDPAEG